MATITLGTIKIAENTQTIRVQYGEAITAGEIVYKKSDGKYWLANNTTTTLAAVAGICPYDVAADGYADLAIGGDIDLGATLAVTTEYVASTTSGAIEPRADLITADIYSRVGYGKTAALLTIDIANTGLSVP